MKTSLCLFLLTVVLASAERPPSYQTHEIVPEKELLITDTKVVDSEYAVYPGPFSFGQLIESLAGERGVETFIADWVELWEEDQLVNGHVVKARPAIREQLIEPWQYKDGYCRESGEPWEVNLANAPFRLLAIVNRLDLGTGIFIDQDDHVSVSTASQYYSSSTPEIRFVFAALDASGAPLEGGFTMILEYGTRFQRKFREPEIPESISKYAAYWHQLGTFPDFNADYLEALAKATSVLTERGVERTLTSLTNCQGEPIVVELPAQESPLLRQIRTNDRALGAEHEFRQCKIQKGSISAAMLDGTPTAVFDDSESKESRSFTKLLNDNERGIKNGAFSIPSSIRAQSKRHRIDLFAGSSVIPDNDADFYWEMDRVHDPEVRRRVAMGTCNGCHSAETKTQFFHIAPRAAGEESKLSDFLSLKGAYEIPDPARPKSKVRLNEMGQRHAIFTATLNPNMRMSQIRRVLQKRQRTGH